MRSLFSRCSLLPSTAVGTSLLLTFVMIVAFAPPPARATMSFHDWQCGSDMETRKYAYDAIHKDCPSAATELNHCCVIHDECYVRQLGQVKCDDDFCECNKRVLNGTGFKDCETHNELICFAMPFFGTYAYKNSLNYTEPEDLRKHEVEVPSMKKDFVELYSTCSTMNSTVSSCAVIFNECKASPALCALRLCSCLSDLAKLDGLEECEKQTTHVCELAILESGHKTYIFSHDTMAMNVMMFVGFLCLLTLIFYFTRLYYKRNSYKVEEIKYTVVV